MRPIVGLSVVQLSTRIVVEFTLTGVEWEVICGRMKSILASGTPTMVGKLPTSAVLRAQAIGEPQGLMKILIGANDDRILGFTMIGSEAGEVMAVVQTAIIAGLPYPRLRDAVLTHPTMAEGLGFLLASVPARNLQTPQTSTV